MPENINARFGRPGQEFLRVCAIRESQVKCPPNRPLSGCRLHTPSLDLKRAIALVYRLPQKITLPIEAGEEITKSFEMRASVTVDFTGWLVSEIVCLCAPRIVKHS